MCTDTHLPSLVLWLGPYLNKTNQITFCKAGFRPLWCCCHNGNTKVCKTHLQWYISTKMWKQRVLKQLRQHPTCLADHGPRTSLRKHRCPQFLYEQGQCCSDIHLLHATANMTRSSSTDHTFPGVQLFLALILYAPELPKVSKAFLLRQPFFKYT